MNTVATKLNFKNIKKIGLGIMAFEGSEHLHNVISEIRDLLDYVIIGTLEVSYHNEPISLTDKVIIESVYNEGLADEILLLSLNLKVEPRLLETEKRNSLLRALEEQGCTHSLIIDADEFYNHDTFLSALKKIDENDYDMTYCQYINYYKDYMHYLKYPFKQGMYVPFITKSTYKYSYETPDFRMPSDPTRRYVRKKGENNEYVDTLYLFEWSELKMHHFSWIRNNIHGKVNAWSAKKVFNNINDLIDRALYDYYHFDDSFKKVHLIFNTPDNTVEIVKFPKQYIHINKDISEYAIVPELKNILILNMSTTVDSIYEELELTCRETWASDILNNKYPNIQYYSVIDTTGQSRIDTDNHKIYVHLDEADNNISALTYRFQIACEIIAKNFNYDYVVKTNTSTWLNIPAINLLIADNYNDTYIFGTKIEQAFWSTFNLYMRGNFVIFSRRTLDILFSIINAKTIKTLPDVADDNYIGSCLSNRLSELNIPQFEHFVQLPVEHFYTRSISLPYDIINNYAVLVKTYDNEFNAAERHYYDNEKMKLIHTLYLNNKPEVLPLKDILLKNKEEGYQINQIKYIKKDWLELSNTIKNTVRFTNPLTTYKKWEDCQADTLKLKEKGGYLNNK